MWRIRYFFRLMPFLFMAIAIAYGVAFITYGGYRMLLGLPICGR